MKIFISVLVLIFSIQSWTKADDIKNFQIEGMSIGDSALDYFSKKSIDVASFDVAPNNDKYVYSYLKSRLNKNYDYVEIYYKKNDEKYIIEAIAGAVNVRSINECKEKQKAISEEIKLFFPNSNFKNDQGLIPADKFKQSKYFRTSFALSPDSLFMEIEVACLYYEGKARKTFSSGVGVTIKSDTYNRWITFDAYK